MRLLRATAVVAGVMFALLVLMVTPAQAEGDTHIGVEITGYGANIRSITVKFKVSNNTGTQLGVTAHLPGESGKQRSLFKKGTRGQDVIEDSIDVPCGTAQVIVFDYKGDDDIKGSASVTSEARDCQSDVNRYKHKTATPVAPPVGAPNVSPSGRLAETGESGLWWAVRLGPTSVMAGIGLLIAGRRHRPQA